MTHVHTAAAGGRRQDWRTPPELFRQLDREFSFTLDAAATDDNALCREYYTEELDGLSRDWSGVVYVNPPYRWCDRWVRYADRQAARGVTVVMLVPVRADTGWWHDVALKHEIRWLRGRIRFTDGKSTAPFANCILVMRPGMGRV